MRKLFRYRLSAENLVSPEMSLILPLIVVHAIWLVTPRSFFENVGAEKYGLSIDAAIISSLFLLSLISGCLLGRRIRGSMADNDRLLLSIRMPLTVLSVFVIGILIFIAYTVWLYNALDLGLSWSSVSMLLQKQLSTIDIKSQFSDPAKVHGVTIFTQLLPTFFIVVCFYMWDATRTFKYRHVALCAIVIFFAFDLLRTVFNAERLSLLETIIPVTVLYAGLKHVKVKIGFLFGMLLLFVLFFVFTEATRSYIEKIYLQQYTDLNDNVFLFGLNRLVAYLALPVNYSFYLFDTLSPDVRGLGNVLQWVFTGFNVEDTNIGYLQIWNSAFANPEFNNLGGMAYLYLDLGGFGIILAFIYGLLNGHFYREFRAGKVPGLMLYPLLVVSNLEFYQLIYLGTSRGFVPLLAMLACLACYFPNMAAMSRKASAPQP